MRDFSPGIQNCHFQARFFPRFPHRAVRRRFITKALATGELPEIPLMDAVFALRDKKGAIGGVEDEGEGDGHGVGKKSEGVNSSR